MEIRSATLTSTSVSESVTTAVSLDVMALGQVTQTNFVPPIALLISGDLVQLREHRTALRLELADHVIGSRLQLVVGDASIPQISEDMHEQAHPLWLGLVSAELRLHGWNDVPSFLT